MAPPVAVVACHCRNCQRHSGAPYSVNLVMPDGAVAISGDLATYADNDTASGAPVLRQFCPRCGSAIASRPASAAGMVVVKAGTLDDPAPYVPGVHLWTSRAQPWVQIPAGVATFARNYGE